MIIGIDISQIVYKTGVSNYLLELVSHMIAQNTSDKFVLFGSSLRQQQIFIDLQKTFKNYSHVEFKIFPFPPTALDILWNKLHILPIEWFIGKVDVFVSSDWTQPPTQSAKKATILYDLIVYKYPEETHNQWRFNWKTFLIKPNIVASQKRRLYWVKKEVDKIICISESTKKDAEELLYLAPKKLVVAYPGV